MDDRDILPDTVKPTHYALTVKDLDFPKWTFQGIVTYVITFPSTSPTTNMLPGSTRKSPNQPRILC
jgi:hypothetical protein